MKLFIYDLETTGLEETARVVEICAYNVETGAIFYERVNPEMKIPKESSNIHEIYDKDVKDCPIFSEILPKFIEFCSKSSKKDRDACLIAHNNIGFDKRVLRAEAYRIGVVLPNWRYMDTLRIARIIYPNLSSYRLVDLVEKFDVAEGRLHCARDDVLNLHRLYMIMSKGKTKRQMYKMSKNYLQTTMPFGKYKGVSFVEIPEDYIKYMKRAFLNEPRHKDLRKGMRAAGRL